MTDMPSYLRSVVTRLAGEIGPRTYRDTDKLESAARFIESELISFGLPVARQRFTFAGSEYSNVIGERKGLDPERPALVIGAHYDSVGKSPGADDNASGIAGLLGIARSLAGERLQSAVQFAAFALEESPVYRSSNMASYHYAKKLSRDRVPIDGMICLEMLGYYCDQDGCQSYPLPFMNRRYPRAGNYIAMVGNLASREFTETIADCFRKGTDLPVVTLNAPAIVVGIDFSDHWSFNKFGFRALMVTDTAFYRNPHYHRPTDLPDTLDYERMAKVVAGLTGAIRA